jgi:beta-glucosidase
MGENINVSACQNTGSLKGIAVLVYINDVAASVTRPNKQLKAFKSRTESRANREFKFTLTPHDLSFIGVNLKRIVEPGDLVLVGNETVALA